MSSDSLFQVFLGFGYGTGWFTNVEPLTLSHEAAEAARWEQLRLYDVADGIFFPEVFSLIANDALLSLFPEHEQLEHLRYEYPPLNLLACSDSQELSEALSRRGKDMRSQAWVIQCSDEAPVRAALMFDIADAFTRLSELAVKPYEGPRAFIAEISPLIRTALMVHVIYNRMYPDVTCASFVVGKRMLASCERIVHEHGQLCSPDE